MARRAGRAGLRVLAAGIVQASLAAGNRSAGQCAGSFSSRAGQGSSSAGSLSSRAAWEKVTMAGSILLLLLSLLVCGSYATSTPTYWKMMLPDTPMPSAIKDLLQPGVGIHPEVMACGVDIESSVRLGNVKYDGNGTQNGPIPDEDIFFLEDAIMIPTKKLLMNFTREFPIVPLLSGAEASKFPFSSKRLPTLLKFFSFHPNSVEAKSLKLTLDACERKDPIERVKYCATSLESMVDFITSTTGTHHVWALSTDVPTGVTTKQRYAVASSPKLIAENVIVCHPAPYPYAVFYCHITSDTRAYVVPLVGDDGTKTDAATICNADTSAWEPHYLAFRMLNLKPGRIPVCHFLGMGGVVWAPRA